MRTEVYCQFVYRNKELCAYLPTRHPKRRKRFARNSRCTVYIRGKRSISECPLDVNTREVPGHWEIDIIIGKGQNSSLIVLVERTTCFTFLMLPWDRASHSFAQIECYFCHPYHSWEKGTVENTNGLIRRMFPKKIDFRTVSAQSILDFQRSLNNRPQKVLGYLTPQECFDTLLQSSRSQQVLHFKC